MKIYTALVQTIGYTMNALVVYIRRLESRPSRRRDNLLSCFVPLALVSSTMLSAMEKKLEYKCANCGATIFKPKS